ncbi:hypothetical protein RND71_023346 [Anisodus tanguticus]|uniref:Serine-threonine kinase receptor-associated protein n=1 Tax=Anisodus tanguticus TaxID=243964 RepID=A0AAE1RTQ6_9SOLA|nr:hypothetical protein RND71_023346 [Anisodus tanguticus]
MFTSGVFRFCASDSSPMLRNGETGDWIGTFEGHKGAVWSCCLDTNALRAASGSADFSAYVAWSLQKCQRDTNFLLTGGVEKVLRIYDMNRPDAPPQEVAKTQAQLWDVRTGDIVRTLETKSAVTSAEVSQDGRYITTCDGFSVKFWDANHFGLVKSYNMPCTVESASLEPKYGFKFVVGGEDMWIRVFDFHTGEELACNKGHHGPVHCVRFAPTGESYASGSEDGTIRIWQTGPLTNDDVDMITNGKVKVSSEEVSRKIEGFQISDERKTKEEDL